MIECKRIETKKLDLKNILNMIISQNLYAKANESSEQSLTRIIVYLKE